MEATTTDSLCNSSNEQTPIPGANRKVGRGNRRPPSKRHQKYFLKPTPNYSNYQMAWEDDQSKGCGCSILIIRMDGWILCVIGTTIIV